VILGPLSPAESVAMKTLTLAALLTAACAVTRADDDCDRNAKAALALAMTAPTPGVAGLEGCGVCRPDFEKARSEAKAAGKVVVSFVGGAPCCGKDVESAGAVACRCPNYNPDGIAPPTLPRVVVVRYDEKGDPVPKTLPAGVSAETVLKAVKETQADAERMAAMLKMQTAPATAGGCYTDPKTGQTVCPLKR
jgi:hypothetical protein